MTIGRLIHTIMVAMGLAILAFSIAPVLFAIPALFSDSTQLASGVSLETIDQLSWQEAQENFLWIFDNERTVFAFLRTFVLSLAVAWTTSYSALTLSFMMSRFAHRQLYYVRPLFYSAYVTPPVVLVLSLGWLPTLAPGPFSPLVVVFIGHCTFLFPLCYGIALGHWLQTDLAIDRSASSDGADVWQRFKLHTSVGSPSFVFGLGLMLLTFMLSWSDVVFSRYLLIGSQDLRLLTDLVIDMLDASEDIVPRGSLAALAILTSMVASMAASLYAWVFYKFNRGS